MVPASSKRVENIELKVECGFSKLNLESSGG